MLPVYLNFELLFFLRPISSVHFFVYPLSWAWSTHRCQPLGMAQLLLHDVLLAGQGLFPHVKNDVISFSLRGKIATVDGTFSFSL